jgi:hypothetical protein
MKRKGCCVFLSHGSSKNYVNFQDSFCGNLTFFLWRQFVVNFNYLIKLSLTYGEKSPLISNKYINFFMLHGSSKTMSMCQRHFLWKPDC